MTQPLHPLETTSESDTLEVCATPGALAFMPYGPICPYVCSLLYRRISRTRSLKASSTLTRCLAEVSTNGHPNRFATS